MDPTARPAPAPDADPLKGGPYEGLIASAEESLARSEPRLPCRRVPIGLAIETPEQRPDGDAVLVYLDPHGGRPRLVDEGFGLLGLDHGAGPPEGTPARGHLDAHGLSYDPRSGEVYAEVPDVVGLPAQALAMGRALAALERIVDGAP